MEAEDPTTPGRSAAAARQVADILGPFLGLIVVVALFGAVAPEGFLSVFNAKTIATQTVIVGLAAIGATFIIRSGGIDLSVGSAIALASVVTALAMKAGLGEVPSALLGVLAGAAVGAVNGGLVTLLKLPPFIVTPAKWLADEQKVDAPSGGLKPFMSKNPDLSGLPGFIRENLPDWLVLAPGVWLMGLAALAAAFLLRRTVFGTWTTAIGSNEPTARLCGVPVERTKFAIYVFAGAMAGLAGVLQFGRLTVGDPTTAMGKELDVIAAVVIGGASLSGGTGTILGAMIGAFLMATLANGCNLSGVPNFVQEILVGAIIVSAVTLDGFRSRQRAS